MIVLGIDPGTAITGYGVLSATPGKVEYVTHGVITTPAKMELPKRYELLYENVKQLIQLYKPEHIATERLFFSKNVNTGIAVGGSIGVILLAAAQAGLEWSEHRPAEVKMAVVGYGAAEKHQVQYMVQQLLKLTEMPKPDDAADALAIALCHCHTAWSSHHR
jgi:crossover junction endodeoxyribonuclease RuvC